MRTPVEYARSGGTHIAYRQFGEGDIDVIFVGGWLSHLDLMFEHPPAVRYWERIGSFARVILFDRRGMGLSDPVDAAPTLEERVDDVRAVMDAAGVERAAVLGHSEGGPASILLAATHPERVQALVLYGAMARTTQTDDYSVAVPAEALLEAGEELIMPHWGEGASVEVAAPSVADDPEVRAFYARMERASAGPAMLRMSFMAFLDTDVRDILPAVKVPTLVMHRRGDRLVNFRAGKWLAEHIPGAKFVALDGIDHNYWYDGTEEVSGEIEEFLLGTRHEPEPDRALLTVLFTDIVGSTETAAAVGDQRWRDMLVDHQRAVRAELARHKGREVKTTGDGFLATFDGPARAIRCAQAIIAEAANVGLAIRAGIHTGECELVGDDIGGIAVHIGQRVSSLAGAGELLTSSTVKDLVAGSQIDFEDRGERDLKGLPGSWRLYAVAA